MNWWKNAAETQVGKIETFLRPMRSNLVKENHIGSVVSEILRYTHTHRHNTSADTIHETFFIRTAIKFILMHKSIESISENF